MRLLLDTHAFLWWLDGDRRLSMKARRALASPTNTILVSAADVAACVASQGFLPLEITILHAQRAGNLAGAHRDPFGRMLIAQSQIKDVAVVSDDQAFDEFDVRRFW